MEVAKSSNSSNLVYSPFAIFVKISISLFMLSFVTVFINQFCAKVLDIPNNDSNIPNVICSVIMIIIASYIGLKQFFSKKD